MRSLRVWNHEPSSDWFRETRGAEWEDGVQMHVGRNRTQQRAGHVHIVCERPLLQNGRMVCRCTWAAIGRSSVRAMCI